MSLVNTFKDYSNPFEESDIFAKNQKSCITKEGRKIEKS